MSLVIRRGGIARPGTEDLHRWRREFAAGHLIRIAGLIEPSLLAWLRRSLESAPFVVRVHASLDPPAVDLGLADERLAATLFTLLNDRVLFDVVRDITGCDQIGCYWPVVYRMEPNGAHHDTWHDDLDGNRMVVMSVNLGEPYEGGLLKLRERATGRILHEVANTGPGDAMLFRLGPGFDHYVSPVTGRVAKMALAGWFQRTPAALPVFKDVASR